MLGLGGKRNVFFSPAKNVRVHRQVARTKKKLVWDLRLASEKMANVKMTFVPAPNNKKSDLATGVRRPSKKNRVLSFRLAAVQPKKLIWGIWLGAGPTKSQFGAFARLRHGSC